MGCLQSVSSSENIHTEIVQADPRTVKTRNDWQVFVRKSPKIAVPSFIRLFVIQRILRKCIEKNKNNYINKLVAVFNDKQMRKLSYSILSRLQSIGLKQYMENYYNEEKQATLVERIFNDIILAKFAKEYQRVTTYVSNDIDSDNKNDNNNNNYYQCSVFNSTDLMCLIFEFLHFWNDISHNCTLVDTHFLCQISCLSLLYHVSLNSLIVQILESKIDIGDENISTRIWQRIVNAKYVSFDVASRRQCPAPNMLILNRLSMLANIEYLECCILDIHINMVKVLMQQCGDKIKKCDIWVKNLPRYPKRPENEIAALELMNANTITMRNLYFYINWSSECQQLILSMGDEQEWEISQQWCDYVVDYCDCSGVKSLIIQGMEFRCLMYDKSTQETIYKFAQKFQNLKQLSISRKSRIDKCCLHLLTALNQVIVQNNTHVQMRLIDAIQPSGYWIRSYDCCRIDTLDICLDSMGWSRDNDYFKRILQSIAESIKDVKWLTIRLKSFSSVEISLLDVFVKDFYNVYSDISSGVLGASAIKIAVSDLKIDWIIDFLTLDVIDQLGKNIFFKFEFDIEHMLRQLYFDNRTQEMKIDRLCHILGLYLTEKLIPIDIRIRFFGITKTIFNHIEKRMDKNGLFKQCKENIIQEYKQPQLNQNHKVWCKTRVCPAVSFLYSQYVATLYVANVQ